MIYFFEVTSGGNTIFLGISVDFSEGHKVRRDVGNLSDLSFNLNLFSGADKCARFGVEIENKASASVFVYIIWTILGAELICFEV